MVWRFLLLVQADLDRNHKLTSRVPRQARRPPDTKQTKPALPLQVATEPPEKTQRPQPDAVLSRAIQHHWINQLKPLIIEHQFTNTISQPLISLKDFAPLTIVYFLCMRTISDRKKEIKKTIRNRITFFPI